MSPAVGQDFAPLSWANGGRGPPPQFPVDQLRDISRTGVLFHSKISFEIGMMLQLPFRFPAENQRNSSLPARGAVKTMRAWELPGGTTPLLGIAVTIAPLDFAQPFYFHRRTKAG
jgi:hypothetical protein